MNTIRKIDAAGFLPKQLQTEIAAYNTRAAQLDSERSGIQNDLQAIRQEAVSGDVDGLATLRKRREKLRDQLVQNLVASVKHIEQRGTFAEPVRQAAAAAERQARQRLKKRRAELESILEANGIVGVTLPGILNESTANENQAVRVAAESARQNLVEEIDRQAVAALRRQIAEMV